MLRNYDAFENMLDLMNIKHVQKYKFSETYVSTFYNVYMTQSSVRSLYRIIGIVDSREWAARCAVTISQPLASIARNRGYKKVDMAIGTFAIGASIILSPIPTCFSLASHYCADRLLENGWVNLPDWYRNSSFGKEIYGIAYVLKSEGIAYGARNIDSAIAEAKEKVVAAKKAIEDAKAARITARAKYDAAKRLANDAQKDTNNDVTDDAATPINTTNNDELPEPITNVNQDQDINIKNDMPRWLDIYMKFIPEFTLLSLNGYEIYKLGGGNNARGSELSLEQAIVFFLNGGSLMFVNTNKGIELKRTQDLHGERPHWKGISSDEITNPKLIDLGITWRKISDLVDNISWCRISIFTADRAERALRYSYIKEYIVNYFTSLLQTFSPLSSERSFERPSQDSIFQETQSLPDSADNIKQQLVNHVKELEIKAELAGSDLMTALHNESSAKLSDADAVVMMHAVEATEQNSNDIAKQVSSQFSRMFGTFERSARNEEKQAVSHMPVHGKLKVEGQSLLTEVSRKIENDKRKLSEIQQARIARDINYKNAQSKLLAAKAKVAQFKLINQLGLSSNPPEKASGEELKPKPAKRREQRRKMRVKHAPTFFELAERDAYISAETMANSVFGRSRDSK